MIIPLTIRSSPGDQFGGMTFFSIPLPRGQFLGTVAAHAVGSSDAPIELWPLAHWPDGSLRMVQGIMTRVAPRVDLEIVEVSDLDKGLPEPVGSFVFGDHELEWCDETKIYRLSFKGLTYFEPGEFAQKLTLKDGQVVHGVVVEPTRIVAWHKHWLRLSARFRAANEDGTLGLHFRIQWDLFDQVAGCVLSCMAIHDWPGVSQLSLRAIEMELGRPSGGACQHGVQQARCGFELTETRWVETDQPLDLRVEGDRFPPRIANFEALGDGTDYPAHLNPPPDLIGPVAWLRDTKGRLLIEVENMAFLRPKGILLEKGKARIGIWPEWTEPMIWPQGRRRQIRVALGVEDLTKKAEPSRFQAHTAALLDTQRISLDPESYRKTGFFDLPWLPVCRPDKHPRIEGWVAELSILKTQPEFFHFGDTLDSHYTRTYYPLGRVPRKTDSPEPPPGLFITSGRNAAAAGAMDTRQPVYVNNEYDVLHCLASEYLRSGNAVLFRQLSWFSRHTIEVDFFCHSDRESLHRAQGAHSVNHTSGGAYPSHFWTQGLAQYYLLTGDMDALEVIRALAEKTVWYFEHPRLGKLGGGINREMGWAVLTLVSAYEVTQELSFLHYARHLIDGVIHDPLPVDLPVLSFGHTSLLLGCKAYLEAVQQQEDDAAPIRNWYLEVARLALRSGQNLPQPVPSRGALPRPKLSYDYDLLDKGPQTHPRSGIYDGYAALACFSYAWRLSGDRSFIEGGLRTVRAFFDGTPGYFSTAVRFRNPLPEGKPFAMSYRSMMEFFQALEECDLLEEFELR